MYVVWKSILISFLYSRCQFQIMYYNFNIAHFILFLHKH